MKSEATRRAYREKLEILRSEFRVDSDAMLMVGRGVSLFLVRRWALELGVGRIRARFLCRYAWTMIHGERPNQRERRLRRVRRRLRLGKPYSLSP